MYITLNKFDNNNHPIKIDFYKTKEEAQARIEVLHAAGGFDNAFYIDDEAHIAEGRQFSKLCLHWVADVVAKTVTFDQASYNARCSKKAFAELRRERDRKLDATDWWVTRGSITEAQTNYRQALRDLPGNTADPANPTWPTVPGD